MSTEPYRPYLQDEQVEKVAKQFAWPVNLVWRLLDLSMTADPTSPLNKRGGTEARMSREQIYLIIHHEFPGTNVDAYMLREAFKNELLPLLEKGRANRPKFNLAPETKATLERLTQESNRLKQEDERRRREEQERFKREQEQQALRKRAQEGSRERDQKGSNKRGKRGPSSSASSRGPQPGRGAPGRGQMFGLGGSHQQLPQPTYQVAPSGGAQLGRGEQHRPHPPSSHNPHPQMLSGYPQQSPYLQQGGNQLPPINARASQPLGPQAPPPPVPTTHQHQNVPAQHQNFPAQQGMAQAHLQPTADWNQGAAGQQAPPLPPIPQLPSLPLPPQGTTGMSLQKYHYSSSQTRRREDSSEERGRREDSSDKRKHRKHK